MNRAEDARGTCPLHPLHRNSFEDRRRAMNTGIKQLVCAGLLAAAYVGAGLFAWAEQKPHQLDAAKLGTAAGTKATTTPDGVVRVGWARTDVSVNVDGMPLK